jgi:ribosome biogenesis SPOUT family RNA methylase Rps3
MKRLVEERNVQIRTDMEMTSSSPKRHAVDAGLGPGILSVHTRELELKAGRLVILDVQAFFDFLIGEDATDLMQPGHAA